MSINVDSLRSLLIAVDIGDTATIHSQLGENKHWGNEKELVSSFPYLFISFICYSDICSYI